MRAAPVFAALLLLSGCAWVKQQLPWPQTVPAPAQPTPRPEPPPKLRPRTEPPVQPPAPPPAQLRGDEPAIETAADHQARCRTMADNRADDAKGLGASPADQSKMRDETFHDCMQDTAK